MAAPNKGRPPEVHVDSIFSWGSTFDEYAAFFALEDIAQYRSILDVGAGPASFTAETNAMGVTCTAVHPMYCVNYLVKITKKFKAKRNDVMASFHKSPERFLWSYYGSPARLEEIRRRALEIFLADYKVNRSAARYVATCLPNLTFPDGASDLALGSHMLFLYSHVIDFHFHLAALLEMLRIVRKAGIYPLVAPGGGQSEYLEPAVKALRERGFELEFVRVEFEHLPGATGMHWIRNAA